MLNINEIKAELEDAFPLYTFWITRRLFGRCIVAMKSKYYGADIFVKKDRIVIEAAVPEWKTRFMLGAGAAYKKFTDKNFFDAAVEIKTYLERTYDVRLRN
jgi:hypothetical protein